MRYLTAAKAATYALLSFSSIASAWPTYNLHNSQFAKRQGPGDLPSQGGQTEEPVFNEEYDFIVAGGTFNSLFATGDHRQTDHTRGYCPQGQIVS